MQKTIFITGATSGFGVVAAKELYKQGNHLIIAARNLEKAEKLKVELEQLGKGSMAIIQCDLKSINSIQNTIQKVQEDYPYIDQVINNAGIWVKEFRKTENNIEETLQVNLIAPYLFMKGLQSILRKSAQPKIINTASGLDQGEMHFEDLELCDGFSGFKAYKQSKLGIILLTRLFAQEDESIAYYTQHPGMVNTSIGRELGVLANWIFRIMGVSPEKGAETLLYLSKTNTSELTSGEFYAKKQIKKITRESYDLDAAARLVDEIEKKLL